MENTATMPMAQPLAQETPVEKPAMSKKDHWMVEVAGGVTLAITIVSATSLWYVMLVSRIFSIS